MTDPMQELVTRQRRLFEGGATLSHAARRQALEALERSVRNLRGAIAGALRLDLGKSAFEAGASEIGVVLADLAFARRNLRRWMRPERRRSPLLLQPGRSEVWPEPRGVALVVSPWNYPFQLALSPLVAGLAAGNTVIVKPSEFAPHTAAVVERVLAEALPSERAAVVTGGADCVAALLEQGLDYLFFTGGPTAGRSVAEAAARSLTPCTLELGGKSPCLVCADANLPVAARRIVWGKFMNAGQTCVAPDTVWADRRIAEPLLRELARTITRFYGPDPRRSPEYGRVVSAHHMDRLTALLGTGRVVCGGTVDRDARYFAPTVVTDLPPDAPLLREEIFGPILPVVVFDELGAALEELRRRPVPLALYVFAEDPSVQRRVLAGVRSGGACVNDTVLQLLNPRLPFGGLGESGWGAYHGRSGFDAFSHRRAVVRRGTGFDPGLRYPPARVPAGWMERLLPWLLR